MARKKGLFGLFEEEICDMAGEYVKEKVTKKVVRFTEMSLAFVLAVVFISIAIVELTATFFPILDGGWNYLIYGMIFLIIGLILK